MKIIFRSEGYALLLTLLFGMAGTSLAQSGPPPPPTFHNGLTGNKSGAFGSYYNVYNPWVAAPSLSSYNPFSASMGRAYDSPAYRNNLSGSYLMGTGNPYSGYATGYQTNLYGRGTLRGNYGPMPGSLNNYSHYQFIPRR